MNADECEVNFSLEPADGEQSIPVDRIPSSLVLISVSRDYMHTNDMFVSLNGVRLYRGSVFYSDGLDAGSEENNVRVSRGPPQHQHTTNIESCNGEGLIDVHPGFHGSVICSRTFPTGATQR